MCGCSVQYFARPIGLRGVIGVNGNEDVPFLDLALVAARFVFGNAHADQRAGDATDCCAHGGGAERGHNRTRGEEWTDARDGERADSREPAKRAGKNAAVLAPAAAPSGALV